MASNAPEPVVFRRNNIISPIYVKPLHTCMAWEMGSLDINNADHTLFSADHLHCGQVDAALLLDDPGVLAEVHCLHLLDQEDCLMAVVKL